jgi:hypothetical protein
MPCAAPVLRIRIHWLGTSYLSGAGKDTGNTGKRLAGRTKGQSLDHPHTRSTSPPLYARLYWLYVRKYVEFLMHCYGDRERDRVNA